MTIRPAPKPAKREQRPRAHNSTLPRPSKSLRRSKQGEGRAGAEPHRNSPTRKSPPKKRPKSAEKFAYQYGSAARVEWVKSQPCVAASRFGKCDGEIQNAHTASAGMGLKAHFTTIAPMCQKHHREFDERRGTLGNPDIRHLIRGTAEATAMGWELVQMRNALRRCRVMRPEAVLQRRDCG